MTRTGRAVLLRKISEKAISLCWSAASRKKALFQFVRSSSVFYPPVERCPFTVRQYGGGRGAKMKPLLGCWASRAMPLNSRQSVVQCTARWSSNSGREVSQREFGELADFAL